MEIQPFWRVFVCALLFGIGCGDSEPPPVMDAGTPAPAGIVTQASGEVIEVPPSTEGVGVLSFKFVLGEQTVSDKVALKVSAPGAADGAAGTGPGNQKFELAPGLYDLEVRYRETPEGQEGVGTLKGVKLNLGVTTSYRVALDVPQGQLRLTFSRQ